MEIKAQSVSVTCPKAYNQHLGEPRCEPRWSGPLCHAASWRGEGRQTTGTTPGQTQLQGGVWFWPEPSAPSSHDCRWLRGWWEETLVRGHAEEPGTPWRVSSICSSLVTLTLVASDSSHFTLSLVFGLPGLSWASPPHMASPAGQPDISVAAEDSLKCKGGSCQAFFRLMPGTGTAPLLPPFSG